MLRSLYSGVSGLSNHQLILDTTANNLANISTSGFKGSRITFSTALTQTSSAGSSPSDISGGINPRQVGLGVKNSSVDVDTRQGAMLATGRTFDLALQGNGFFRVQDATGAASYTRVGSFGFDSKDNLVDLGSGNQVQGKELDETGRAIGDRGPISIALKKSIDANGTTSVTYQGNLSAKTPALAGKQVTTVLPLYLKEGTTALSSSLLSEMATFTGPAIEPALGATKTVHVFGTKPDGSPYAGSLTVNPWRSSVSDLLSGINAVLVQGAQTIGNVALSNGNLVATATGEGSGFSLFIGEQSPLGAATAGVPVALAPVASPAYPTPGTAVVWGSGAVDAGEAGLLAPTFTKSAAIAGEVSIKVKVTTNGVARQVGAITIPAASAVGSVHRLASMPHVAEGDVVTYEMSSSAVLAGGELSFTTDTYLDSSAANLLGDTGLQADGSSVGADGLADIFQEDSAADLSKWQYAQSTNATMDWFRLRFAPEAVASSVQVYDSVGGVHTLEARFFRTGTRSVVANGETVKYTSWDAMFNVNPAEGTLTDPLIVGIEFDEAGRYRGNSRLGSTPHGSTLSDSNTYSGTPSDNTLSVLWNSTGTTTISLNLGDAGTTSGLSGFGSSSNAVAIDQDGFASGTLDTMSVAGDGRITGLYSNGKAKDLYQLEIATFRNPAGLTALGNNMWQVSANSGDPLSRVAGEGGAGTITSGSLEGSNVDIASEFTRLITAQRGFQVNSKVIQTTDSILQELTQLIR